MTRVWRRTIRSTARALKQHSWRTARTAARCLLRSSAPQRFPVRSFGSRDRQVFFGYYDVSPFSPCETKLLGQQAPLANSPPEPGQEVAVGTFDLTEDEPRLHVLGRTTTWCWQMGCRLQWNPADPGQVCYNRLVDGRYGFVVQEISSGRVVREFGRPMYALSGDGRWGLSTNFARLGRLRPGYGYADLADASADQAAPDDDGIWRIDLRTGNQDLILPFADLATWRMADPLDSAQHYVNHLSFSPSGDRFVFQHLADRKGQRRIRLISSDLEGTSRCLLNDSGHASHAAWRSDGALLIYDTVPGSGTHFHLYRPGYAPQAIGRGILTNDGHPTFFADGQRLLLDSYPDRFGEHPLMMYDTSREQLQLLGEFYNPPAYRGEVRCDLHPRLSPSNRYLCVDSPQSGVRAMYVMDLESLGS